MPRVEKDRQGQGSCSTEHFCSWFSQVLKDNLSKKFRRGIAVTVADISIAFGDGFDRHLCLFLVVSTVKMDPSGGIRFQQQLNIYVRGSHRRNET